MAEHEKELHFAILNIVATPHPPGTYERLIREAARKSVNFWGDQYAQIGDAEEIEPGLLWGRLVIWTEIDPDEPAILKNTLAGC
jgi:hypothetical protein